MSYNGKAVRPDGRCVGGLSTCAGLGVLQHSQAAAFLFSMGIIARNVERCKRGAGLETCFCGGAWSRRYAVDFFLYSSSLSSKKGRKEGQGSALDPVGGGRDPAGLVGLFCLACGPFLIRRPWRAHRLGARGRGRYPLPERVPPSPYLSLWERWIRPEGEDGEDDAVWQALLYPFR